MTEDVEHPGVCEKVRLHRERLAVLREKYYWDEEAAGKAVRFIEGNIRHWKSPHAGKKFLLSDWQRDDIVKPLFGLKMYEGGPRLFREAYIQIARKNGKTALSAALILLLLFTDGEGLEMYTAATKQDQAMISFSDCVKFVQKSPKLKRRARILKRSIEVEKTSSTLAVLSADYSSMDGLNVAAALIDELHAHKTPQVHDVIVTGTGSRDEPLVINITTAGEDAEGVCKALYDYSADVLKGQVDDDSWFPFIAEADDCYDWTDPRAFMQANMNMGVSVKEDYLWRELKKAKATPSYRKTYRRYSLNRWVEVGAAGWFEAGMWSGCRGLWDRRELMNRVCYGGLDLATTTDLTSLALMFPMEDGLWRLLNWYWMPEENIQRRVDADKVPYDAWVDDGWIIPTQGNVVDYRAIVDKVVVLSRIYNIKMIAYDTWNAAAVNTELMAEGFEMREFVQGLRSFHPPSTEFEKRVIGQTLEHDGNPVTAWCAANVQIFRDQSDKIRPVKGERARKKRIDGIVAAIMAGDLVMRFDGEEEDDWSEAPDDLREQLGL